MTATLSLKSRIYAWLIAKCGGHTAAQVGALVTQAGVEQFDLGYKAGEVKGESRAKLLFHPLPMPFTAEQLSGREYGQFITPVGFGNLFGECNIPAPSPHGYEQRAYYVARDDLDVRASAVDLRCHGIDKFGKDVLSGGESNLVPVIVTVLR